MYQLHYVDARTPFCLLILVHVSQCCLFHKSWLVCGQPWRNVQIGRIYALGRRADEGLKRVKRAEEGEEVEEGKEG